MYSVFFSSVKEHSVTQLSAYRLTIGPRIVADVIVPEIARKSQRPRAIIGTFVSER